ncbi:MAG: GNAT family N-acetyltransferase [Gloeomargarita sp. SKYBB_i_bin120]|nr:GNAT family N-acetyltransferase [Gloeomargarita sp. SKYG98]MCS7292252.1 GNAT family N-acetyltransferase [Gloeomargarita sp. SKYB120]MDW8177813.1 GNAT family N-acetyltransferase [Gloeomargarita sp. SKYBB_i_bin120]
MATRPLGLQDVSLLAQLLAACFPPPLNPGGCWTSLWERTIEHDIRQRLERDGDKILWLGTWREGKLVGAVELSQRQWRHRQYIYLANLAVAPAYRRQGIGRALLQLAEQAVQSWPQEQVYLHVMEDNQAARNLYAQLGYQVQRWEWTWRTWLGGPRRLLLAKTVCRYNQECSAV